MVIFFLKLNFKTTSIGEKLRKVDWVGSILFVAATTGFLIPLTWGGVQYPWSHWRTLVSLIICAVGLIAFVLYEEYVAENPLIPMRIFKKRTAALTYLQTFIHGMILWCILYYLPLYYEGVKGFSPILTGVALFPETFTVAPASIVAGVIIAVTGRYRWGIWIGWVLTVIGLGLLTLLKVNTSTAGWIFLNLVSGVGTGILFSSMAIAVQASASNEDQAFAVTMFAFFRAFGQTVGVAIGGVIFQNEMLKKLKTYPLLAARAVEYSADSSGLVQIIKTMPEGPEKTQLKQAYTDSIRMIFIVICALAGVALVAGAFTEKFSLDRQLETEQGYNGKARKEDEEKVAV